MRERVVLKCAGESDACKRPQSLNQVSNPHPSYTHPHSPASAPRLELRPPNSPPKIPPSLLPPPLRPPLLAPPPPPATEAEEADEPAALGRPLRASTEPRWKEEKRCWKSGERIGEDLPLRSFWRETSESWGTLARSSGGGWGRLVVGVDWLVGWQWLVDVGLVEGGAAPVEGSLAHHKRPSPAT
jgi:hypothetical protein